MITYLRKSIKDKTISNIQAFKTGCWVHITDPTLEELKSISRQLHLELGHLTDALDPHEVPRLEMEDGTSYIFTRIPHKTKTTYVTMPTLFVLASNFVLTISRSESDIFNPFIQQKIPFVTTQKVKLVILMIKEVNNSFNRALNAINREVYAVTHRTKLIKNKDIINLVLYEQTVNDFLNALIRTNTIHKNLLSRKTIRLYEEDRDIIEDLSLASEQLIDLAKNTLHTISNLRDAHSTILTNNLNRVVKLFTSLTVVLTIPTMIASFYGMNVALPFSQNSYAFGFIALTALAISAMLIVIFSKNEWL
jgi:magnesium transporter